jgi:hypothetical protein
VDINRQTIKNAISPELGHSSEYWAYRLKNTERPENLKEDVFSFLRKHYLHWIEAMIILSLSNEVVRILESLYRIFQVNI